MTVVTNAGTADIWPIFHVFGGGASSWSIINNSVLDDAGNPLRFVYNPVVPPAIAIPGGDYAILDMFENTIILASSGRRLDDGIVMEETDFFPFKQGANNITKTGGMTLHVIQPVTAWA